MKTSNSSVSELPLHSLNIHNQLESVESAYEAYKTSLNEISDDIRTIEQVLKQKKIHVEFSYPLPGAVAYNSFLYKELSWSNETGDYRLLYNSCVGNWNDSSRECKPLIECKIETRLEAYSHLAPFLAAFAAHLLRAKAVRERSIEKDVGILFGL